MPKKIAPRARRKPLAVRFDPKVASSVDRAARRFGVNRSRVVEACCVLALTADRERLADFLTLRAASDQGGKLDLFG